MDNKARTSRRVLVFFLTICTLTGCATQNYMIATNFHTLNRGMPKQAFVMTWQNQSSGLIGGTPSTSRSFRLGSDIWDVFIYDVYNPQSIRNGYPYVDHQEHVAFKNNRLEEWGPGTLPITLQENPNKVEVNVNVR